jgi:hypothetical protein
VLAQKANYKLLNAKSLVFIRERQTYTKRTQVSVRSYGTKVRERPITQLRDICVRCLSVRTGLCKVSSPLSLNVSLR